jgi:hypothetical protein
LSLIEMCIWRILLYLHVLGILKKETIIRILTAIFMLMVLSTYSI